MTGAGTSRTRLKHFGWGRQGSGLEPAEEEFILARYRQRFAVDQFDAIEPPGLATIDLRSPRIAPPPSLAAICTSDHYERAAHTYGKSFPETVNGMLGDYGAAPDVVAFPRDESEVAAVLDWAGSLPALVTPFGGGSSVVGGVAAVLDSVRFKGSVTIDLRHLNRVVEIDRASRAARIEGGIFGPDLEAALKPSGLTLRHFPQSFEYSTLGGWIATRSGGHYATLATHIDDFVESLRIVSPQGVIETRRLPGSGAGPSPDRLFIGSEGILGMITEAWMRLQDRPRFRAGASLAFPDFMAACRAVRAVAQTGLHPSNCRVLDAGEAWHNGAGDGRHAVMVLAFESADHALEPWLARALECCRDHGGAVEDESAANRWRNAFIRMPFARERVVPRAIIADTFETAITWDRFEVFHDRVKAATEAAIREATGRPGLVTCRLTHVYPDGPAPYFSFHALGRHGALIEQWRSIKQAASDTLLAEGGTITHHHAVGRDHRPWYDRQRPDLFAAALRAAKRELDPQGLLNPGVLIDP